MTMAKSSGENSSRRHFVKHGAFGLVVLAGVGCQEKEFTCTDESALSDAEKAARKALVYKDRSPAKAKKCVDCQQYVAGPDDSACGTCKIMAGPIHPAGTCNVFTAKS